MADRLYPQGDAPEGAAPPMAALYTRAPWLRALARVFDAAGAPLYAVGGAVRNTLMGVPLSDIDVCGPARPEAVVALCEGTPVRAHLRAAHFGTVELHYADADGRHMAEYTTFRHDSYRCGHRPEAVRFTEDMAVDATRRDFSVNALYCPLHAGGPGEVADPTGGLEHLRAGVLYTVTADPDRVLRDDGLRILRLARFQAELGLTPAPALLASAARHAELLNDIYPERLHEELRKLLLSDGRYPTLPRPGPATRCGLRTLADTGAFARLFGSLEYDEAAVAALSRYAEPEDVLPVAGRLALLFARGDADVLAGALARLRFPGDEQRQALLLHATQARLLQGDLPLFDAVRAGLPAARHSERALLALAAEDARVAPAAERARALCAQLQAPGLPLSLRDLAVNGAQVEPLCAGLPPRAIGAVLTRLWRDVVIGACPNAPEALLAQARAHCAAYPDV